MDLLIDCFSAVEGLLAAELSILRKEYHGGSFEGRPCSRILANVGFLALHVRHESADLRTNESGRLSSEQPGARLNAYPNPHCLRCLHEFDKGICGPVRSSV